MKILWAIDPLIDDKSLARKAAKVLTNLKPSDKKIEITPVYVFSPVQVDLPVELPQSIYDLYYKGVQKALDKAVAASGLQQLNKPVILDCPRPSLKASTTMLIDYAKKNGATCIVVSSHARRGIKRLAFGSFTEQLFLKSSIPVLATSSNTSKIRPFKTALFPTDFSEASFADFEKALHELSRLGTKVVVYHKIPASLNFSPFFTETKETKAMANAFLKEEYEEKSQKGREWAALAGAKGVLADVVVENTPHSIPAAINKIATKKKVDLIAMAGQAGALEAAVIGSITREVLRDAQIPVWIFHHA